MDIFALILLVWLFLPFSLMSKIKRYYKAAIVELLILTDCYVCLEYQKSAQIHLNAIKETENLNNKYQLLQAQMHSFEEKFEEFIQHLQEDKRRKILEGPTSIRYRFLESRIDILEQYMENIAKLCQDSENQQVQEFEINYTLSQNTEKLRDRVNMLEK